MVYSQETQLQKKCNKCSLAVHPCFRLRMCEAMLNTTSAHGRHWIIPFLRRRENTFVQIVFKYVNDK